MDARIFTCPRGLSAVSPRRRREIARAGGRASRRIARLSSGERHELAAKGGAAAREAWALLSDVERRQRIDKAVSGQRRARREKADHPTPVTPPPSGTKTVILADGLVRVVTFDLAKMVRFPGEQWRLVG